MYESESQDPISSPKLKLYTYMQLPNSLSKKGVELRV